MCFILLIIFLQKGDKFMFGSGAYKEKILDDIINILEDVNKTGSSNVVEKNKHLFLEAGRKSRRGLTACWRPRTGFPASCTRPMWAGRCGCWWTARAATPAGPSPAAPTADGWCICREARI